MYEAPLWKSEGIERTLQVWEECFEGVSPEERPSYNWCDKGCGVAYYLSYTVSPARAALWSCTYWLIDRFHGGISHKASNTAVSRYCRKNCDVSKMIYNARSAHTLQGRYPGIWSLSGESIANSEAAEHTMNKVKGFKNTVQSMRIENQRFFLLWMSVEMNEELTRNAYNKRWITPEPNVHW